MGFGFRASGRVQRVAANEASHAALFCIFHKGVTETHVASTPAAWIYNVVCSRMGCIMSCVTVSAPKIPCVRTSEKIWKPIASVSRNSVVTAHTAWHDS